MIDLENKKDKILSKSVKTAFGEQKRLVAPLLGFPGVNLINSSIKLAQQNYIEHYKVIKELYATYEPDAIFPLMDLSVEANALGRYTVFPKEESATVVKDKFSEYDYHLAKIINIKSDARLNGYIETVKLMKENLPSSVLRGAYVTGPYTLAGLLIGADEAALSTIMNPNYLHQICELAKVKVLQYIELLIEAGVQMICILEPSAVMLSPEKFSEFSGMYVQKIVESYSQTDVAMIYHICGNTMHLIKKMCETGVDALSLDSVEAGVDFPKVARGIPEDIILIGNISPVKTFLNGSPEDVENEVNILLEDMEDFPNFILSTGCDLPQEASPENIYSFMKAGKNYRIKKI